MSNDFNEAAWIQARNERRKDVDCLYKRRGCTKRSEARDKAISIQGQVVNRIKMKPTHRDERSKSEARREFYQQLRAARNEHE